MVKSKQNPHPGPFKKQGGYTRFLVRFALLLVAAIALVTTSCGGESQTVLPFDKSGFATSSLSGTTLMTVEMVYPANGATVIPVDSKIVLAFSKDVNSGTIAGNITIDGSVSGPGIAYTFAVSGNIVTLTPTPTLAYSENITINIGTGVTASSGEALYAAYTGGFQAEPDGTAPYYPRVITGTNLPSGGAESKNTIVAQVTFTKAVAPVNSFTVSIAGGAASITGWTQVPGTNTYQFTLSGLAYNTTYTISLAAAGTVPCISDGTNCLVDTDGTGDNYFRWSFTTENDPALPAMLVDSYWTSSIDHESAIVYFTTSETVDVTAGAPDCRVRYGTAIGGPYPTNTAIETNWDGGSPLHILHMIPLGTLTASTTYYYRAYVDLNNNGVRDFGEPQSAQGSFTTRRLLSIDAANQTGPVTLQDAAGGGFVFWLTNQAGNNDIYGQYYNSAGVPGPGWTVPGGSAVSSHANSQAYFNVLPSNEPVGAIVTYLDGNDIRAKHINSVYAFSWPAPGDTAAGQGIILNRDGFGTPTSDANATQTPALAYIVVTAGINDDSFAVAYISTTNTLRSVICNTIDGTFYQPVFDVDTTGAFTAPYAVSDENDNYLVFYHNGANVLVKSLDGDGVFRWGSTSGTVGTTVTGLGGYTVVKALARLGGGAPYDAYVLATNGTSTGLVRVRTATGTVPGAWNTGTAITFTGKDPDMIVDTTGGAGDDRIIVVYRVDHGAGNHHIEYRIYNSSGNLVGVATAVSDNAAGYNCSLPKVTLADASSADSGFYVSWFDGRLAAGDYAVYTARFDAAGALQWRSFVYDTAANGGGNAFALNTLYWDDGGAPFGIMPIWQEYTVATDIYYEKVSDTGSY